MAILDKAKSATGRARGQAKHGAAVGQARLAGAQARRLATFVEKVYNGT